MAKTAKTATKTATALKAAIAAGKYRSRTLLKAFGAAFTAANEAGKIEWKRIAGKGKAKGFYVATAA